MYVARFIQPDLDSFGLREFTTKDSLTDTVCIEDFIDLESGKYIVTLSLIYYLNGEERVINSDEEYFFVNAAMSSKSKRKKNKGSEKSK